MAGFTLSRGARQNGRRRGPPPGADWSALPAGTAVTRAAAGTGRKNVSTLIIPDVAGAHGGGGGFRRRRCDYCAKCEHSADTCPLLFLIPSHFSSPRAPPSGAGQSRYSDFIPLSTITFPSRVSCFNLYTAFSYVYKAFRSAAAGWVHHGHSIVLLPLSLLPPHLTSFSPLLFRLPPILISSSPRARLHLLHRKMPTALVFSRLPVCVHDSFLAVAEQWGLRWGEPTPELSDRIRRPSRRPD